MTEVFARPRKPRLSLLPLTAIRHPPYCTPTPPSQKRHDLTSSSLFLPSSPLPTMFSSKTRKAVEAASLLDFSQQARDPTAYVLGQLTSLGIGSELSALAFDPVQSLLAVGTEHGKITVFGQPSVQLSWEVGVRVKVKHLAWRAGSGFLCVVGTSRICGCTGSRHGAFEN